MCFLEFLLHILKMKKLEANSKFLSRENVNHLLASSSVDKGLMKHSPLNWLTLPSSMEIVLKPTYSTPREPTYCKCFFCVFLQIFRCYDFPTCISHDTNSSRYGSAQSPLPEIQHCSEWVLLRIMNYSIHFPVESRIPVVVGTIFMWAQSFAIFQLNTKTTDMKHQLMIPKNRKT